jgi:hypothetical protein
MMQIKFDELVFNCQDSIAQLSLGSHATITVFFDIKQYPEYEKQLIKLYESSKIFTITTTKFQSKGCKIKTMSIDFLLKRIEISIHVDVIDPSDVTKRRDDSIDNILKNF